MATKSSDSTKSEDTGTTAGKYEHPSDAPDQGGKSPRTRGDHQTMWPPNPEPSASAQAKAKEDEEKEKELHG